MRKRWLAASLILVPATIASANELDGLNSPAIDISSGYTSARGQYAAVFASMGADGNPDGIVVQSRYMDEQEDGWIACTRRIALPSGARRASHPALSRSGWLFISASSDPNPESTDGWRLYAMRRGNVLPALGNGPCDGWDTGWDDLGHFQGRPVASAPDAVVAYDRLTFVFVTGRGGRIDYRMIPSPTRAMPSPPWGPWRTIAAASPASRRFLASSKPAAAIYNDNPSPGIGFDRLHLFWHDASHRNINHVRALIGPTGGLTEDVPDFRPFGYSAGAATARTACSAGPEIKAPNPLFIVCGNDRTIGSTGYSIARYSNPGLSWASVGAVEMGATRPWIDRAAFGGFSAPSIGRTGVGGMPFMFMTFGNRYCPQPIRGVPADSCTRPPDRWAIQKRWSSLSGNLTGWEPLNYQTPARAAPLE
jgi:hypothetical protein